MRFRDRSDAGKRLAALLQSYADDDVVVLALPRGGVPVAMEVARALNAQLDVLGVRKLGAPSQPEFGIGAIAEGGIRVVDRDSAAAAGLGRSGHRRGGAAGAQRAPAARARVPRRPRASRAVR